MSKNRDSLHKIIKKRIILEEEYMISPEGEKKLLSVKRLEKEDNNNDKNDSNNKKEELIKNYFKKRKNINKNKPKINKHNMHNSLFSSIFKENYRKVEYNRTNFKSIDEDSQIVSNISYYNSNNSNYRNSISKEDNSNNLFKNLVKNQSHIKNRNNKILYKILKNSEIKSPEQNNYDSEVKNKELNLKKKLFYNKICLMKDKNINNFNKSNNNNSSKNITISSHSNFLNTNRTSMKYIEDKEKSKIDSNKSIYQMISFSKEQPFMIYHKKEAKQNFIINNNQNYPNLVNIVFLNQEKNKKINNYGYYHINGKENSSIRINIPLPKIPNHLKRTNYRFHEIKSMSIGNYSSVESKRNYYPDNYNTIMSINNENSSNINNNSNSKIYSNRNNFNINGDKYFEINNYDSSKNVNNRNLNKKIEQREFNNNGITEYYIKY